MIKKKWAIILSLAIVIIIMPNLTSDYIQKVLNTSLIHALLVLGVNFIVGYTGQMSFGQAGFWCIGAYVSAYVTTTLGYHFAIGMIAAMFFCAIAAVLFGYSTLKLKTHYFALATMGFTVIMQQLALNLNDFTGGGSGFSKILPISLLGIMFNDKIKIYYLLIIIVTFALFISLRIENSKYGRAFMAIRENEVAAGACGIDIAHYKILAFVLSSIFAGAAGSLYGSVYSYISPEIFTTQISVTFIIMLVVGGVGTASGALIGAILLTFLPEWLRFFGHYYMMIYGFGVVAILVFMPKGIVGLYRNKLGKVEINRAKGASYE